MSEKEQQQQQQHHHHHHHQEYQGQPQSAIPEKEKPPSYEEATKDHKGDDTWDDEDYVVPQPYNQRYPNPLGGLQNHVHTPHPRGSPNYPGQHVLTYNNARNKPGI
ncbi:HHL064Wp [Eremothecium sinecaudum]|uniref:HHL064Wp n=1 Tax=Eremothecium sinecaudum TaxID=45286 RepID=A0A0X8HVX2_9SACH|nr:HHL064Wp [Eremothecium sinecaudum]AMD22706.1 HHL064Wp [Eremothecium sinecaudum]